MARGFLRNLAGRASSRGIRRGFSTDCQAGFTPLGEDVHHLYYADLISHQGEPANSFPFKHPFRMKHQDSVFELIPPEKTMPNVNHSFVAEGRGGCMLWGIVLAHLLSGLVAFGQVNSWTKPTSGAWQEPVWSLGILPSSSQTIEITNAGFKAVGINPSTATGFPGSLTINHLDVLAPTNSANTLLLNFFGTNPPLRVINGVNVGTNGRILNLSSGLRVDMGGLAITNGSVAQDGGFVMVGDEIDVSGSYNLTNGLVQTPALQLVGGGNSQCLFTQDGGTNSISDLVLRGGSYDLS